MPTEMPFSPEDQARIIAHTRAWVDHAVIGLNLCPFAKAVQVKHQIRYVLSTAQTSDALHDQLFDELSLLAAADPKDIDTTLLIHPQVLQNFDDYLEFVDVAEAMLRPLGLEGVLQVASFHPNYQFEGTAADDITNATNRSPYPMLHLIREASIDRAVAAFPEAEAIFEANMATMRKLGPQGWAALQQRCADDAANTEPRP